MHLDKRISLEPVCKVVPLSDTEGGRERARLHPLSFGNRHTQCSQSHVFLSVVSRDVRAGMNNFTPEHNILYSISFMLPC